MPLDEIPGLRSKLRRKLGHCHPHLPGRRRGFPNSLFVTPLGELNADLVGDLCEDSKVSELEASVQEMLFLRHPADFVALVLFSGGEGVCGELPCSRLSAASVSSYSRFCLSPSSSLPLASTYSV
jgi:hypothetical protein